MGVTFSVDVTGAFGGIPVGTQGRIFGGTRVAVLKALDPNVVAKEVARIITVPINRFLRRPLMTPAPPRTNIKFIWSLNREANARARRWWFWALREGLIPTDGQHYRRSGVIPASWIIRVSRQGNPITITADNPAKGSEFVYGSEEPRPQVQVPGHSTTGWPFAINVFIGVRVLAEDEIQKALEIVADKLVK